MAIEFAAFMVLALVLGFKHSYDADHLVAVSNLITRSGSVRKTSLMSVAWAAGHMVTAAIITVLLYTFRQTLLTEFLAHLDDETCLEVLLVDGASDRIEQLGRRLKTVKGVLSSETVIASAKLR